MVLEEKHQLTSLFLRSSPWTDTGSQGSQGATSDVLGPSQFHHVKVERTMEE